MSNVTSLRMRVLPGLPSRVSGTNGLYVDRDGLDFVVRPDFGVLTPVPSIQAPEATFFQAFNEPDDSYSKITFQNLVENIQDVVIGPTTAAMEATSPTTDQIIYFSGPESAAVAQLSSVGRDIIGATTKEDQRTALELGAAATSDIGNTAGTVAAGDDDRIVKALQPAAVTFSTRRRYGRGISIREYPNIDPNGNDAFDSGPGISAAIASLASEGGGTLEFFPGFDARIKTPIVLQNGVFLSGPGKIYPDLPNAGRRGAAIRAAANMPSMITQPDLAIILNGAGIEGMTIDGRKDEGFVVSNMILLSPVEMSMKGNNIVDGSGTNIRIVPNNTASWINWICDNTIGGAGAWNIWYGMTDGWICNNYISGGGSGNLYSDRYGNLRVTGNQFEVTPGYGALFRSPDSPALDAIFGDVIANNNFDRCNAPLRFAKGTLGTNARCSAIVSANRFSNTSGQYDIYVEGNLYGGYIGPNTHIASDPTVAHIGFAGTGNVGWSIYGVFRKTLATVFQNLPADADVHITRETGEGFHRSPSLVLASGVNPGDVVPRGSVFGSAVHRGLSWVASIFGTDLNGAHVALGSDGGQLPTVAATQDSGGIQRPLRFMTSTEAFRLDPDGKIHINFAVVQGFANDAAAKAGGYGSGTLYRNTTTSALTVST